VENGAIGVAWAYGIMANTVPLKPANSHQTGEVEQGPRPSQFSKFERIRLHDWLLTEYKCGTLPNHVPQIRAVRGG
jgi:hypothetical protein